MKQSTLGSFIRALRKQHQMTQAQLADRVGVTDKAVSKWERDISYPDIALFPRLADILGVTVNDLLEECTDEAPPSRLRQIFEMSHDIRTPLHIILGCVDLARAHREDEDRLARYLEDISVCGEYLLAVIDRAMRTASQDEHGTSSGETAPDAEDLARYLERRTAAPRERPAAEDFSGRRFLIADDLELNREITSEILRQTGAQVDFAEDGHVCLEKVAAAPAGYYDLILMDILMPGMDGVEATRRIRALADGRKARVPIVAMTANVYEKDRKAAFDAGMNAFAEKPIAVDKLFEVIRQCLAQK